MLLVGAVGSHLTTLCQLALHVADVQVLRIDTSKQSNFFDGLRSAVRLTGSEGKILTLMFTVSIFAFVFLLSWNERSYDSLICSPVQKYLRAIAVSFALEWYTQNSL